MEVSEVIKVYRPNNEKMIQLAALTDGLVSAIPSGSTVGYVDYPVHRNVGDLLIYLGSRHFFEKNQNIIQASFSIFNSVAKNIEKLKYCEVIICHGGGNFGDIYPAHQQLREQIVAAYPEKPIVILPQTFHFSSNEAMIESGKKFQRHGDVTIAVRDTHSAEIAKNYFSDRVLMVPDMAHRLYDKFSTHREVQGITPLALMRRDVEAVNSADTNMQKSSDWDDLLNFRDKMRIGLHRLRSTLSSRIEPYNPDIEGSYYRTVLGVVDDLADRLVKFDPWTTSRLHGAIFGLLLGKNVSLHDNSYGKNSRYFAHWGSGIEGLTFPSVEVSR